MSVPGFAVPDYMAANVGSGAAPLATSGPTGYTPAQIRHAYGFDQVGWNGAGTTIAIVDAYSDPNIANDLHQFDQTFGLADPKLSVVNETGGTRLPSADAGWATEIALDVEWAHAIAPGANILLVEANSASFSDLLTAVNYARYAPGVVDVSMSWGGGEFSSETFYDSYFTTPAGHGGVTFLASSGDSGAPVGYPAISPNVLAVGGTSLYLDASGNILGESGWSGSGGGISAVETQPGYQKNVVTQSTTRRTNPDVSYDADPNTGFPVYNSYSYPSDPWGQWGGTSDAAPQWAALIAIADQGRIQAGLGSLDGVSQTLPMLYSSSVRANDFYDITSGSSTGSPKYSAGTGYDLVTGLGSPIANRLISDLAGTSSPVTTTHMSIGAPTSSTAGAAFSVTVSILNSSGSLATNYTGTVHFTSSDSAAVLPADYIFTANDGGTHTFSVTLKTAGSENVTVTDNSGLVGSTSVTVNPNAATQLAFGQQPTNVTVGQPIAPAVTVRVLDAFGNLVTGNSSAVTLTLGTNPGGATLGGTTTVTAVGGVATFSNLSISNVGNGYTLTASDGTLTGATSASFNVAAVAANTLLEGFETNSNWYVVGGYYPTAYISTIAAHDGNYGLVDTNGNDWIYRNDAGAQVQQGDTISVWLRFAGSANGRAYFGFGAGAGGTLSLVAAPNTGQLILQDNSGWGFYNLAAVHQSWQANHWYRLEVDWGKSGTIVGKVFDSNGTRLLGQVSAVDTAFVAGGFALRATGNNKYWDTVTLTPGANSFVAAAGAALTEGPTAPATTHPRSPLFASATEVSFPLPARRAAAGAFAAAEHEAEEAALFAAATSGAAQPAGSGADTRARYALQQLIDFVFGLPGD